MLTVSEAVTEYRLGRNRTLRLINTGEIPAVRLGRRILIPRVELDRFISRAIAGNAAELTPCHITDSSTR